MVPHQTLDQYVFFGSIENVQGRPKSGTDMIDMVIPRPNVIGACARTIEMLVYV
jgi:hypothetical protein